MLKVHDCLSHVWDYGSPAEKREANKLLASKSLEQARLDWEVFPEQHSVHDRKLCLSNVHDCLSHVWDYGSPAEKREANKLLASKSLEQARLDWEVFPEPHSVHDRKLCLSNVHDCLFRVWDYGSPAEKREANKLLASKSLEQARLDWEVFPEPHSVHDRKVCSINVHDCLRLVWKYGSPAEKREANVLEEKVNQEQTN